MNVGSAIVIFKICLVEITFKYLFRFLFLRRKSVLMHSYMQHIHIWWARRILKDAPKKFYDFITLTALLLNYVDHTYSQRLRL